MDGAFFPQADFDVPEKKMRQHTGQHVMVPALVFPDLVMIQTEFGFGFLKALLNGPPKAAEPYEKIEFGAEMRVAYVKFVIRILAKAPAYNQPDFFLRQAVV